MPPDKDYILGTHGEEIDRLALQHRVWRPRALDGWQRAGFTVGKTILDVGCGPGHAAIDLAEIVGPTGKVIAIDRSRRFLDFLESTCANRGLGNVTTIEADLDLDELPKVGADGAWCRWVFAFLKRPRDLLARVAGSLKPGGVFVAHEYYNYSGWRLVPRSRELEDLIQVVISSWRSEGGEPDIGLNLTDWLSELGFEIQSLRPIIEIVSPANFWWQWPKTFVDVGLRRLVNLGHLSEDHAAAVRRALATAEANPRSLMFTPAVLEIIAVRR